MYSEKVMEHFNNPRNMDELENPSGVGKVGNPTCGDVMQIAIKINKKDIIEDVKFKTFGCAAAIAASSIATEMIKGKHINDARKISNQAIAEALDGLPPQKIHCSVLAADAINMAIDNYLGITRQKEEEKIICKCMSIPSKTLKKAISHGATSLDDLRESTGTMTGACKGVRCSPQIEEIIKQLRGGS